MFITEYVSQEDINKFKLDELLSRYQNTTAEYKHHWVVDKETGNWLVPVKKLNNFEAIWILHYKNIKIEIKLYKAADRWDLTSISSNSLNNQEIIVCVQEALKVLGNALIIWAVPKKTNLKEKREIKTAIKEDRKRKITYLDILTAIIVVGIMFYIANDRTNNITPVAENDNNKTSKKTQTTKPAYNIYSVVQTSNDTNAIYGINHNKLDTWSEILSLNSSLSTAQVDNYGNIYWGDRTNKAIYKANPDGSNIRKIITVPSGPSGLAIDNEGERIFWSQWLPKKKYGEIGYSDLSGNNKTILVSDKSIMQSGGGMFYDSAYDKLYVCDQSGDQIIVIDLKTKETTRLIYSAQPSRIVVDYKNSRIIWTDTVSDNISSADLDGSNKKVLIQFDDQFSNPSALTIDTINERLIYEYYDRNSNHKLETSNLDGTNKKIEEKTLYKPIKSLFFVNNSNNYLTSEKIAIEKPQVTINKHKPYDISKLKKCFACHGKDWSKSALGKSAIVKNMSEKNIAIALKGYKSGSYGGSLKALMKGQVAEYSDKELDSIAQIIKTP